MSSGPRPEIIVELARALALELQRLIAESEVEAGEALPALLLCTRLAFSLAAEKKAPPPRIRLLMELISAVLSDVLYSDDAPSFERRH